LLRTGGTSPSPGGGSSEGGSVNGQLSEEKGFTRKKKCSEKSIGRIRKTIMGTLIERGKGSRRSKKKGPKKGKGIRT